MGVEVVVVTFETGFLAQRYLVETGWPWPLLVDEQRQLYHGYGMLEAGFWDLWGPSSWRAYWRELVRGRFPKPATGDIQQRGGDVLIDPQGVVRYHHIGKGPADRPSVATLLAMVSSI